MKNAIVLGSAGKVGQAIIRELDKEGFRIVGSMHSKINHDFPYKKFRLFYLDMKDKKSIDQFIEKISNEKIDLFVSTIANRLIFDRFENISQENFEEDLNVNLLNHIYFLKKILPLFNEGANIIFILTEHLFDDDPKYFSSYVISKYALLGLTKCLAAELKTKKIRVNAVSPGMMETNFISSLPNLIKETYKNNSVKKRLVLPEEVASEIIKIVKDSSLNGKNIKVF